MKSVTRLAIVLVLTSLPALALAAPPGPPAPPPPAQGPDHLLGPVAGLLHELDLTAQQRARIRTLVHEARDGELGESLREVEAAHHRLEILTWDADADDEDIAGAVRALAERVRGIALARHELALDILEILTQEQRDELQARLEEGPPEPARSRHGGRRGRGPRPPAPPAPPAAPEPPPMR